MCFLSYSNLPLNLMVLFLLWKAISLFFFLIYFFFYLKTSFLSVDQLGVIILISFLLTFHFESSSNKWPWRQIYSVGKTSAVALAVHCKCRVHSLSMQALIQRQGNSGGGSKWSRQTPCQNNSMYWIVKTALHIIIINLNAQWLNQLSAAQEMP